ncbi:MAG TPA: hypothetical protein VKA68_00820 [bacterium]|nr:hypothetical protein [bacterium]
MKQKLHLGMELNGEKSSNRMSLLLLEESDQMASLQSFLSPEDSG